MCSRSLEKFTRSLKDSLQKLRTPSAGDDGADSSTVFDSPAVETENKTLQVCKPLQVCKALQVLKPLQNGGFVLSSCV